MRRWSRLLGLATMFSAMLLTTNVLSAQDKCRLPQLVTFLATINGTIRRG